MLYLPVHVKEISLFDFSLFSKVAFIYFFLDAFSLISRLFSHWIHFSWKVLGYVLVICYMFPFLMEECIKLLNIQVSCWIDVLICCWLLCYYTVVYSIPYLFFIILWHFPILPDPDSIWYIRLIIKYIYIYI